MTEQFSSRAGQVVTFYSYKGGTGRTMALANTAWILAANGKRVLAVDWDLEAPGLDRFLHPFLPGDPGGRRTGLIHMITSYRGTLADHELDDDQLEELIARCSTVRPHAVELAWNHFPDGGSLSYLPAGQGDWNYDDAPSYLDWNNFYENEHGARFLDAMREDMTSRYDYVLIDSRTGLSDTSGICTITLPDTLVVCFTLSDQSINGASFVARSAREQHHHHRRLRVLPVPMRVDEGELEKAQVGRELARSRFAGFPEDRSEEDEMLAYWSDVEFPYRPFYAYEEMLAVFGDKPGERGSLLSVCERLTREITGGEVTGLPPMPEPLRQTYRARYTRGQAVPRTVHVAYAREDEAWGVWLCEVLKSSDYQVSRSVLDRDWVPEPEEARALTAADRVAMVVSRAFQRSEGARAFRERASGPAQRGEVARVLSLLVGSVRRDAATWDSDTVLDLAPYDERNALRALLRAIDPDRQLAGTEGTGLTSRYPGGEPEIWSVPPRNRAFTGRGNELERLRELLQNRKVAVLLPANEDEVGSGGLGKTQLAREFVYRYRAEYDLVWWIAADQRELVPVELARLARRIEEHRTAAEGFAATGVTPNASTALDQLRRGSPTPHWLLVFDNAGRPSEIAKYLPSGEGHVVITSRNAEWSELADPLPVDVFTREESIDHLRTRVERLSRAEADQVASTLGDLPLAVEVAAAWLSTTGRPVDGYLRAVEAELGAVKDLDFGTDYPPQVAAVWRISIRTLRESAPAAARVLELCAFFGPEPISMSLLQDNSDLVDELSDADPRIVDGDSASTVFEQMGKYSLARIDNADKSVQLHRLIQLAVRADLDERTREQRRQRVHQILTDGRKRIGGDVDREANWPALERIWPHLGPAEAKLGTGRRTRELMVDWVRYLWVRGEFTAAQAVSEELDELWTAAHGNDRITLQLRRERGNILRSQGSYVEALRIDEDTLKRQRELLGDHDHVHTLITAGNVAADLRALGRYPDALEQDEYTLEVMTRELGPEHVRTLRMANNVALDHRLLGNYNRAEEIDRTTWLRRDRVLGSDAPETLRSLSHLARDMRDSGQLKEAINRLQTVKERLERVQGEDHIQSLSVARNLAVSLRLAGYWKEALKLNEETLRRCRERYGPTNPETRMCELNLAADLWTTGDHAGAVHLAREVHVFFSVDLGPDHPNTLGSADNLAVYLGGDKRPAAEHAEALRLSTDTVAALEVRLGPAHPFTLCAMINLANLQAENELLEESVATGRTVLERSADRFGGRWLDGMVCRSNLAITLDRLGRHEQAGALREEAMPTLSELLGLSHPEYVYARQGERICRILELQPW